MEPKSVADWLEDINKILHDATAALTRDELRRLGHGLQSIGYGTVCSCDFADHDDRAAAAGRTN